MRNRDCAFLYCLKDETRAPEGVRWSQGLPRTLDTVGIEELRPWQRRIYDSVLLPCPRDHRKIRWYWETTGGTGKTFLTKCLVDQRSALVVSGKASDVLAAIALMLKEKREAPEVIVWDIPRSVADYVSYQSIEKLKDGCFFSGKYESGMVRINTPHILCFANQLPDLEKLSADRWVVKELVGLD